MSLLILGALKTLSSEQTQHEWNAERYKRQIELAFLPWRKAIPRRGGTLVYDVTQGVVASTLM